MRRQKAVSLGEALDEYIKSSGFEGRMLEIKLIKTFPSVVGSDIAGKVKSAYIKNGKLYLNIISSEVRMELMLNKSRLLSELNEQVGRIVINDIILK